MTELNEKFEELFAFPGFLHFMEPLSKLSASPLTWVEVLNRIAVSTSSHAPRHMSNTLAARPGQAASGSAFSSTCKRVMAGTSRSRDGI